MSGALRYREDVVLDEGFFGFYGYFSYEIPSILPMDRSCIVNNDRNFLNILAKMTLS